MKSFRTDVSVSKADYSIDVSSKVLTIGSCFADAIGARLNQNKFPCLVNPFGVLYNPHSIHKVLLYAIHNEPVSEHHFLQRQDIYLNYDFHSEFSSPVKEHLTRSLKDIIGGSHYFLMDATCILITYGTAWVYERADTGEIVANCHKMPSSHFRKRLFTESEITQSFENFYVALKKFNPDIKIILTVSPVRHIKDTLELNSVSKSVVRVACHTIAEKFKDVEYFPAYEMVLDDLRDYRFYKSDMLHPTEEAEDYIWEKFGERYFTDDTKNFIKQWKSIRDALSHKPFHPASEAHQQFLKQTLKRLEELKSKVNVEEEIVRVRSLMFEV